MKKIKLGKKKLVVMTEDEMENIRTAGMHMYSSGVANLEMFMEFAMWGSEVPRARESYKRLVPKWEAEYREDYMRFKKLFY